MRLKSRKATLVMVVEFDDEEEFDPLEARIFSDNMLSSFGYDGNRWIFEETYNTFLGTIEVHYRAWGDE